MASPQCENGYTKIANEIMEALISYRVPGEQMQVLLCIIRASYGWNEKSVSITHQEIADQTGMARPSVSRAISGLVTKKLLKCEDGNKCLIFNKNHEEWEEQKRRDSSNKKVTKKVTKRLPKPKSHLLSLKKERNIKEKSKIKTPKKTSYTPPSGQELKSIETWINKSAWDEWIKYRADIKKPYKTEIGVTKALKVLRPFNETIQQEIIDRSISAEYQGLFAPKNGHGSRDTDQTCRRPKEITEDNCDELYSNR